MDFLVLIVFLLFLWIFYCLEKAYTLHARKFYELRDENLSAIYACETTEAVNALQLKSYDLNYNYSTIVLRLLTFRKVELKSISEI